MKYLLFLFPVLLVACSGDEQTPARNKYEKMIDDCIDEHFEENGCTYSKGMQNMIQWVMDRGYIVSDTKAEWIRLANSKKKLTLYNEDQDEYGCLLNWNPAGAFDIQAYIGCIRGTIEKYRAEIPKDDELHRFDDYLEKMGNAGNTPTGTDLYFEKMNEETFARPLYKNFFLYMAIFQYIPTPRLPRATSEY